MAENEREHRRRATVERVREILRNWKAARDQQAETAEGVVSTANTDFTNVALDGLSKLSVEWLRARWGESRPCPYCDVATWTVGSPYDDFLRGEGKIKRQFEVTCDNCGHVVLMDAHSAGLLPSQEETEGGWL